MSERTLEVIARLRDEMSGGILGIAGNMDRMAAITERSFDRVNRTISMVKLAAEAVMGSALIKGSIDEGATLERARMQLESVLGSEEKAAAAMRRLREIPSTNLFGTDEIVQAFVRLEAIGVPAAEKTIGQLRNIAVIFNQDLGTAVDAFVSRRAQALSRLGVDVQKVGNQVVLTSGQMRVVTDDTAAAMRVGLLDLWEKRFPDAAARANSTFSEKMAGMRSAMLDVAGEVGEAFLPQLKHLADNATSFVKAHGEQLVAVANSTGEIFSLTADFIVQKLDQTIFAPEFWAKLPLVAEQAFGNVVTAYSQMLVVMAGNWDIWLPVLLKSFAAGFDGLFGATAIGFERMMSTVLQKMEKMPGQFAGVNGQMLANTGRLIESWIPGQERALQSGMDALTANVADQADAALGLLDARLERFRLDHKDQSLLDQGMSLIGGVADDTGLTKLGDDISAAIAKSAKASEDLRQRLAGVKIEGAGAMHGLEDGAGKAEGKLKKVKTAAEQLAEAIKAGFAEIDASIGPVVDKMDAVAALRKAQLQNVMDAGIGAGGQNAAGQAYRDAERQLIEAKIEQARGHLSVLKSLPGQDDAAAALSADIQKLTLDLGALDRQSQEMTSPWTAFTAGLSDGLAKLQMTNEKWKEFASQSVGEVANALQSGIVDNISKAEMGMQSWAAAGKNLLLALAQSLNNVALKLAEVVLQQMALDASQNTSGWISKILGIIGGAAAAGAGSGGGGGGGDYNTTPTWQNYGDPGFALGGIIPGGLRAIPRAATGGIFHGAQLAMVGDNPSQVEAAVPLPNGREIPVQLKGGGGGTHINFTIHAADPRGIREMLVGEERTIVSMIENAVATRPATRRRIRGE
jgi:hypothetical protein